MGKKKVDRMGQMAEKALKGAVAKALEKHKRMGVPAVFVKDGKMVYLMPDGKIVDKVKDWKNPKGIKPLKFR